MNSVVLSNAITKRIDRTRTSVLWNISPSRWALVYGASLMPNIHLFMQSEVLSDTQNFSVRSDLELRTSGFLTATFW